MVIKKRAAAGSRVRLFSKQLYILAESHISITTSHNSWPVFEPLIGYPDTFLKIGYEYQIFMPAVEYFAISKPDKALRVLSLLVESTISKLNVQNVA
ncbi:MAG: hypothetical protein ACI8UR_002429, partial [Natronomonas sp.]